VKPERQRVKRDGSFVLRRPLPERWWQYGEKRPALRRAIAALAEVLVIARVSKTVMPLRVPTGQIMSEQMVVFASDSYSDQAVLSSSLHQLWAITYGSTLETRVRYTPSDVFETFSRPESTEGLEEIGRILDEERREIMLRRDLGLTKLYNLVNDPAVHGDTDVDRLRELHVEIDEATTAAYGWADVLLGHGFHTFRQVQRWTIGPAARIAFCWRIRVARPRRRLGVTAPRSTAAKAPLARSPCSTEWPATSLFAQSNRLAS
jgi:hypothetical protein